MGKMNYQNEKIDSGDGSYTTVLLPVAAGMSYSTSPISSNFNKITQSALVDIISSEDGGAIETANLPEDNDDEDPTAEQILEKFREIDEEAEDYLRTFKENEYIYGGSSYSENTSTYHDTVLDLFENGEEQLNRYNPDVAETNLDEVAELAAPKKEIEEEIPEMPDLRGIPTIGIRTEDKSKLDTAKIDSTDIVNLDLNSIEDDDDKDTDDEQESELELQIRPAS